MRFLCVVLLLVLGLAVQADVERVPRPRLVAHRGAFDLTMPEASRPAYRNAVTSGSCQREKRRVIKSPASKAKAKFSNVYIL